MNVDEIKPNIEQLQDLINKSNSMDCDVILINSIRIITELSNQVKELSKENERLNALNQEKGVGYADLYQKHKQLKEKVKNELCKQPCECGKCESLRSIINNY